jgi:cation:H+ antiporter
MLSTLLQFLLASITIVVAGTALTRCADVVADRTGLGRLVVGSVLLAAATSLPELTVDVSAVLIGAPDLAVGDLMGSSLINLLILAIADLSHRSRGRMLSRASAAHALSATMSIALTALAALAILVAPRLDVSLAGLGPGSLAIAGAYVLGIRMVYHDQRAARAKAPVDSAAAPAHKLTLRGAILGYIAATAFICIAGPVLARAASSLAELSGLGTTFLGTSLVAFCTSLPELVATVAALRLGAFDLALGNILGSNSFNMALLAPLDLVHPGSLLAAVSPTHAISAVATILVTAVAVLGQLYQVEERRRFVEPDALLVILLVLGAQVLVYALR